MDEQKRPGNSRDADGQTRRQGPVGGAMPQSGQNPSSGQRPSSGQIPVSGRKPSSRQSNPSFSEDARMPVRPKSVRRANPLPPDQSIIASDFHKRLRGKPTHAAQSRSWYGGIGSGIFFFVKVFVVIFLMIVFVLGGFGGGMLVGYISTTQPLKISDYAGTDQAQTTFVYDKNNNEIQKLTGSDNVDRVYVSYSLVKNTYIDEAITSIEDERFYEHNGIDIQRIGSAVLSAFSNGGTATHGGSTITQQTVKMISGHNQVSTQRKIQEWFLAMDLEKQLTKDEIMDLYINQAPMGNNYIGIQTAAQNYFGKDAKDLSLTECAFLAGIPKSPSYYNPLRESGKRNALRRMRVVLAKMHELGKITDKQYEQALNSELVFKTATASTTNSVQSFFVEFAVSEVITDLMEQRNISRTTAAKLVYNNGYRIYTTEEPTVQAILDTAFSTKELFQKDPALIEDKPEKPQGGMVVINNETGAIAAMQGGFGEKTANYLLNRAVDAQRQTGSSIKPLIDYAPAFERNEINTAFPFQDKSMNLDPSNPGKPWPKNAGSFSNTTMTVRQALYKSSNVIAVQVWFKVGGDVGLYFLKQVGIDRTKELYPSTAIGAFNVGISPLQMAGAYAAFPNKGTYREPSAYSKVLDSLGNTVITKSVVPVKVYSPETSYLISSILQDVITRGTASGHVMPITTESGENIEVAGKTGTTEENNDKWFCGYTPYYTAATWYGYDNRLGTTNVLSVDLYDAQLIWNDVMQKIHMPLTPSTMAVKPYFLITDKIVKLTICTQTGLLATDTCVAAKTTVTDYFVKGSSMTPTAHCPGHATPTPVVIVTPTTPPGPTETDPLVIIP